MTTSVDADVCLSAVPNMDVVDAVRLAMRIGEDAWEHRKEGDQLGKSAEAIDQ